ncbi:flagellar hook-length control protein FliK [Polaromonas sp.]|uniref:flagellar hook-length control protein FliK n=1 Tax=Polaromonas sp. TaxID=1869339 RepID=UPI003BABD9D6
MNVVAPLLVDRLQGLKLSADIAGPGIVPGTATVSNDVRLPSREAMQQLLGADLGRTEPGHAQQASRFGEATTLSVAARAISAILGATPDRVAGVRGAAPVWPAPAAPLPVQLAGALARVVATSGLFYESHLQQLATGTRPLALLAQEPQARLGALARSRPELFTPMQGNDAMWLSPGAKGAATTAAVIAALTGAGAGTVAGEPVMTAPGVGAQTQAAANPQAAGKDTPDAQKAVPDDGPRPGAAGRVDAAYGARRVVDVPAPPALLAGKEVHPDGFEDASGRLQKDSAPTLGPARSGEHSAATIHPDAVPLVRQQLDVLAMPAFRWGGEAWPGTPMEWEIREEPKDTQTGAQTDAAQRTWSTRLAITLPTLKDVEVRLSLSGSSLQVNLGAREVATVALLGAGRDELPRRFADLGLQLTGLQLETLPVAAAPQPSPEDADAS